MFCIQEAIMTTKVTLSDLVCSFSLNFFKPWQNGGVQPTNFKFVCLTKIFLMFQDTNYGKG